MSSPTIYTFYSFKGGVGRSMAMANIAEVFYRQGKKVVMIDWDLEAPGLEGFFYKSKEELEKVRSQPGLIDFLESYKSLFPKLPLEASANRDRIAEEMTDEITKNVETEIKDASPNQTVVANVIQKHSAVLSFKRKDLLVEELTAEIEGEKNKDKITGLLKTHSQLNERQLHQMLFDTFDRYVPSFLPLLQPISRPRYNSDENKGSLWLFSAGWRSGSQLLKYAEQVLDFDWNEFYQLYRGELFFEWMRKELKNFADVVLIDSRTGITEMGGICTKELADVVVLFTASNLQNVIGVMGVAESVLRYTSKKNNGQQDKKVVIIPSRLDVSELEKRNRFQLFFESSVKDLVGERYAEEFWSLHIPYIPHYAYNEDVIIGAPATDSEEKNKPVKAAELEAAYVKIASYISGDAVHIPQQIRKPELINPFVGLRPYNEDDNDKGLFYGRDEQLAKMLQVLLQSRLLIVTGPPGSGKTSAVQAGLLPALESGSENKNIVVSFQPGQVPFQNLGTALRKTVSLEKEADIDEAYIERLTLGFAKEYDTFNKRTGPNRPMTVVMDQFEELFFNNEAILATDDDKKFVQFLQEWLLENNNLHIIILIRSDYCGRLLASLNRFPDVKKSVIDIGQFNENELQQLIVLPATKAGLRIEEGLPERIIADVKNSTAKLRLIQCVMIELWQRRDGNVLTHSAYNRLGGTGGVFRIMSENATKHLPPVALEEARPLLTSLVQIQTNTRRLMALPASDREADTKLKPFVDAGLVAISLDARTNTKIIELTDDRLTTSWKQLRDWVQADKDFLLWKERLAESVRVWKDSGERKKYLWQGEDLAEAHKRFSSEKMELSIGERLFLTQSFKLEKTEKQRRKRRVVLFAFAVLALVAAFFFIQSVQSWNTQKVRGEFQAKLFEIGSLSGQARHDSICKLSNFNNAYNDPAIQLLKDSLFVQCRRIEETVGQTQTLIDTFTDSIVASAKDVSPKTKAAGDSVDKIEYQIKEKKVQIRAEINPIEKQKLIADSAQLAKRRDSIIRKDPVLKEVSPVSLILQNAIEKQASIINRDVGVQTDFSMPSPVSQNSAWFKKGYFLQFENIKLSLVSLSTTSATVSVCKTDNLDNCQTILAENKQIDMNTPCSFDYGGYRYLLRLDKIGSAGRNPFTKAAYVTFEKYKNK